MKNWQIGGCTVYCQGDKNRFLTLSQKEDDNVSEVVKIADDFFAENFWIAGWQKTDEKPNLEKEDLERIAEKIEEQQALIKDEEHKWLFYFLKVTNQFCYLIYGLHVCAKHLLTSSSI